MSVINTVFSIALYYACCIFYMMCSSMQYQHSHFIAEHLFWEIKKEINNMHLNRPRPPNTINQNTNLVGERIWCSKLLSIDWLFFFVFFNMTPSILRLINLSVVVIYTLAWLTAWWHTHVMTPRMTWVKVSQFIV